MKQPMDKTRNNFNPIWLFFVVIIAGVAARLLAATCGHNYDLDSYQIVLGIVDHGGNVYVNTERYNYGPIWFHVIHVLNLLAWHNPVVFRYLLAGFLSVVDVGIFSILWRKFGRGAACLFFLNPISVIISGYHGQFDNLAILLALLAVLLLGDEFNQPIGRRKLLGLFVLGLSLATKHVFFAFPFWLAVKQKGILQKLGMILIPISLFLLSFVPYWHEGSQGIIQHVFRYDSNHTEYFYNLFVPAGMDYLFSSRTVWFFLLLVFAFICKTKNLMESLLVYICVLVATAPATTNQYLAIPIPFVATHVNVFTMLYTCFGTWHLLVNGNGIQTTGLAGGGYAYIAIFMLCLGLIWTTWRPNLIALLERCFSEVKSQMGFKK